MERRQAALYLLNQLTDLAVGNSIEDLGNKVALPQVFNNIVNLGCIDNDDVESYNKIKRRILAILDLMDKEMKFFYEVGKIQRRKNKGKAIFKELKKNSRVGRKLKKHDCGLII